jgi:hypothetical protein
MEVGVAVWLNHISDGWVAGIIKSKRIDVDGNHHNLVIQVEGTNKEATLRFLMHIWLIIIL